MEAWQLGFGGPEAPEVTEPSRLVGESSGGEVRKQQLDTRVRQEPPGGPVSGAGGEARGLKQALEPRGDHGAAWAWAPPLPCNGLPRGCWNPLVGAPACPSPGPLPSGWGFPAFRGPRRPRAQSSLGQPSTSPLSCPKKRSYTTWSLGRAVRGRRKSAVRAPGFLPQPCQWAFGGTNLVLTSASVSPCALIEPLFSSPFLLWVGPWEKVRGPRLTHKCQLLSPPVPFSCQAPPASLRKVRNEGPRRAGGRLARGVCRRRETCHREPRRPGSRPLHGGCRCLRFDWNSGHDCLVPGRRPRV